MRVVYSLLFIVFCASLSFSQSLSEDLKINGLHYYSTKKEAIAVLGQPDRINSPNYECGFLSSEEQGKDFESLQYGKLILTGAGNEKYIFEEIPLNSELEITYKNQKVTSELEFGELIEIFGLEVMGSFHESYTGEELVRNENSDDGLVFHLQDGRLMKIEYWSPC